MDNQLQSYTYGRLVAVVERALDRAPNSFASNCIKMPRSYFTKWLRQASIASGEHQKPISDMMSVIDPEWAFPIAMPSEMQAKAWEGYYRQMGEGNRAEFGKKITELRRAKGLTQEDLSSLSGIDRANLSKIESGKYNVSVDLLERIAKALGATIDLA